MRRLIFLLLILLMGVVVLSRWRPGAATLLPPAPTATLLPDDFTLIPTFVPSYPCELQNVELQDDQLCRYESVHEQVLFEGDGVLFVQRDDHMGEGCWDSINQDIHELHLCARSSGAVTTLTTTLTSALMPSPDGEWLAFGSMNVLGVDALKPHVFRVRRDGTGLQALDSQGFPDFAVGAPQISGWSSDGAWLNLTLWDGSGENGYHAYRLKTDGSGVYEPLTHTAS